VREEEKAIYKYMKLSYGIHRNRNGYITNFFKKDRKRERNSFL
jgi:hypothetical protein